MEDFAFDVDAALSLAPLGPPFHLGITTVDLAAAIHALGVRFDVQWTPVITDPVPGLATLGGPSRWSAHRVHSLFGPLHFEVFQGSPGSTWDTHLPVLQHHWAYWSRDVTSDSARLRDDGWTLELFIADGSGQPTDFAYLTAADGRRVELVDMRRRPSYHALVHHRGDFA